MKEHLLFNKSNKALFVLFFVMAVVIISGGYYFYRSERNNIRKQKFDELSAIANLKIDQLTQWRTERLSDAEYFASNDVFIKNTSDLLSGKNLVSTNEYFSKILNALKQGDRY